MALLILESFEGLDDPADKYTIESSTRAIIDNTIYRTGSQSLECDQNYWFMLCDLAATIDTGVLGFAMRIKGIGSTGYGNFLMFYNGGTEQFTIELSVSGIMYVERGSTFIAQARRAFIEDKWYYIEVKFNAVNSIGADTFIIKVDGEEWINLPATTDCQGAGSSGVDRIYFQGACSDHHFDDVYLLDLTGAAPNNDFLGDIQVLLLDPDGNGNSSDFVGIDVDSTDNFLHVDETIPDGDTSYVESSTAGHKDLYTFEDLPATPNTIFAVQTTAYQNKDDSGARTGKLITRVSSTDYEGSAFSPVEATYGFVTEIWALNPNDSLAWEEADVNGAEFGIKVES